MRHAILTGLLVIVGCPFPAYSANADSAPALRVFPTTVILDGPQSSQGLLVSLETENRPTIDLTRDAVYQSPNNDSFSVDAHGKLTARCNGEGFVEVTAAGQSLKVPVTVRHSDRTPVHYFDTDIIPILSRFGCNSSACHGKAEGQKGFKLSVFGFDARADHRALVHESRGRRVFLAAPDHSLLLAKASGTIAHGGGVRLAKGTREYETIREWIAAGARFDDEHPKVTSIEVYPKERILSLESVQQLRVTAIFEDDSGRDVTELARFRSNNEGLATVDKSGLVQVGSAAGHVAIMAGFLHHMDTLQVLIPNPVSSAPPAVDVVSGEHFIDRHVARRLQQLNIVPSSQCDDATFLRRAFLDIIGTLPTVDEARQFLSDTSQNKRTELVDRLLERPEYEIYWALKWSDILHVDRAILGHRRAYAYYRWIRDNFRANRPMDEFARDITTASGPLDESPQGGFYQAVADPGDRASAFSQVFLGIRIDCAECHHHPFDRWSQDDYYGMTAYFSRITTTPAPMADTLEIDGTVKTVHPRTGEEVWARPLGTETASASPGPDDPRPDLAEWLTSDENPWFARNLANRMWAHFFGSGLVEPIDDVRLTNPPSNPDLLGQLASWLQSEHYDMKSLIRLITSSHSYQRTTQTNVTNAKDIQNASRSQLRPLQAEVLLDAISQTTGISAQFDGAAPGVRAIELWDSKLQHPFLRLFGRPERKTACECERSNEPGVSQVLHFMNSPQIFARLNHQGGTVSRLVREIPENSRLAEELYLTFLSRFPTDAERQVIDDYFAKHPESRRDAAVDLAWSLINTLEFSFNH